MQSKLAHLFLIRDNLNHEALWRRFFYGNKDRYTIYAHAKQPDKIISPWLKQKLIHWHCETEWGRSSLVLAELLLLDAALEDPYNQFFLLHSESCVPLRTFDFIYQSLLQIGQSWLYYHQNHMDRYNGVNQSVIAREHFLKSSQFFCLTREHAELMLESADLNDWQHCWFADEHYIATTLSQHGRLGECFRQDVTFSHWPRPAPSPNTFRIISDDDLGVLKKTTALFARKFAIESNIADHVPQPFPRKNILVTQGG